MRLYLYLCLICQFAFQNLIAQTAFESAPLWTGIPPSSEQSLFDSWSEDDILSLRLEANFTELIARKNQGEYQAASLVLHSKEDREVHTPVKIKARGKYRRRICDFPPLKIKIGAKHLSGIELKNYKTFKLVTHCANEGPTRSTILREYLAYQIYATLTEQSYRVQLVEITYVDEGKELPRLKRYGILLEDTDELEDRLGGENCDCAFTATDSQSQEGAALVALFQFMIGNNDWHFKLPRNLKVINVDQGDQQIVVPYDFDFSALVDAPYAFPNIDYQLADLRDRVLLIEGLEAEALDRAAAIMKSKRNALEELISNQEGLSRSTRKELLQYLESFYTLLDQSFDWTHEMVVPFEAKEK